MWRIFDYTKLNIPLIFLFMQPAETSLNIYYDIFIGPRAAHLI